MVRASAYHSYADAVALIPAGEAIDDVDAFPGVKVINGTFTIDAPDLIWVLAIKFRLHVIVSKLSRM
jgi:hypothetical protein